MRALLGSEIWHRPLREIPQLGVGTAALAALVSAGFALTVPVWAFVGLVVAVGAAAGIAFHRWPGQRTGRQLHLRIAVEVLAVTVVAYASGWGAALTLLFVFPVADNVRYSGSRAARPALAWSLGAITVGQVGIAVDRIASFIDPPGVHGVAVLGALALVVVSRRIRDTMADREDARTVLADSEERFRALVSRTSDIVLLTDADGVVTWHSPAAREMLGYAEDALVGTQLADLAADEHRGEIEAALTEALAHPGTGSLTEFDAVHAAGQTVPVEAAWTNLLDTPSVGALAVTVRDISERKHLEAQLEHRAFHDPLTGLANRALFVDRVEHAVARSGRRPQNFAVLLVDLDGFKAVNDTLGHAVGDWLLTAVASRLQRSLRDVDTAARIGGDEFAILLEDLRDDRDAGRVAERVLEAVRQPVPVGDRDVRVNASVGIAPYRGDERGEELLRNADIAMYMAKGGGKDRYEVFEPGMHAAVVERLALERDLSRAVEREELLVHYQPIVELDSGRITGVEALLRWNNGDRGLVSPGDFIPLAEETGLIVPIGRWVLFEACSQVARWQREHPADPPISVAVNVSVRQLAYGDFVADVSRALLASGIEPGSLTLEITESALLADGDSTSETLRALKELGVTLAVDDFGTGYSSLAYLQRFPFDVLKIDRSFIRGLSEGTQTPALVRAIVDLGRSLHLQTVAEGIEEDEQLDRFRELRCNLGQGFLFARPADGETIGALLADRADLAVVLT